MRIVPVLALGLLAVGCADPQAAKNREVAISQVNEWVERLDSETTATGVYIRHQGDELPDDDPWGNPLRVRYSRGGVAEIVKVTSAGPDGLYGNSDDIHEERQSANLAGIGNGIKTGVQELTSESAKGVVKGLVSGVKESLPKFGKKDDDAELAAAPEADPADMPPE